MAIVPAPMMASDRGRTGNVTASTLVMNPASRSPGSAGTNARTPVARITASPRRTSPSTATSDRVDDALDTVNHPRPINPGILDLDPEPMGGAGLMKRVRGADERLGRI